MRKSKHVSGRLYATGCLLLCVCLCAACAPRVEAQTPAEQAPVTTPGQSPAAEQHPPAKQQDESSPFANVAGAGDLLVDFTIALPPDWEATSSYLTLDFTWNGRHAGSVMRRSYYPEMPYLQFMNNHSELLGDAEEVSLPFAQAPWLEGLEQVVKARYLSDDFYNPQSGNTYEHITYYLIFKERRTLTNGAGETMDYQPCYELDFVTTYHDVGVDTPALTQAQCLEAAASFALKEESLYAPAVAFDALERLASDTLMQALQQGATPPAAQMCEALGGPNELDSGFVGSVRHIFEEAGNLIWQYTYEAGGVQACLRVNMDTGEVSELRFTAEDEA